MELSQSGFVWSKSASVTPWYNRKEFEKVATALYSEHINDIKWGLDKVEVWKLRTYPALPAIIDTTAVLVYAKLRDKQYKEKIVFSDEIGISLLYAEALISFVNWIAETIEDKSASIPLRAAAKKLNIPGWIVDLRHSASHSCLPRIDELQCGVTFALNFFQHRYWQDKPWFLPNRDLENVSCEKLFKLIEAYKAEQFKSTCESWEFERKANIRFKKILAQLQNLLEKNSSNFFDSLLKPTMFFLSEMQLDYLISDDETSESQGIELPMQVVEFWAPLIEVINASNQIPPFVVRLLECQKSLEPYYQKYACAWAYKLIKMVVDDVKINDTLDRILTIYEKRKWSFDWFYMTCISAANPSIYMPAILIMVLQKVYPPFDQSLKSAITTLLAMFLGALPSECEDQFTSQLYTWMDIQKDALPQLEYKNSEQLPNPWKEASDDIDWETIPLGYVFDSPSDFIGSPPEVKTSDKCSDKNVDAAANISSNESQNTQSSSKDNLPPSSSNSIRVSCDYILMREHLY